MTHQLSKLVDSVSLEWEEGAATALIGKVVYVGACRSGRVDEHDLGGDWLVRASRGDDALGDNDLEAFGLEAYASDLFEAYGGHWQGSEHDRVSLACLDHCRQALVEKAPSSVDGLILDKASVCEGADTSTDSYRLPVGIVGLGTHAQGDLGPDACPEARLD